MAAHETILITGATGLLGRSVVARVLDVDRTARVVALVRDPTRIASLDADLARVSVMFGDVRCPGLGITADARRCLERTATSVIHLAADTTFSQPIEHARSINVDGTAHAIDVASSWRRDVRFVQVSTAFVAGRRTGLIAETSNDGSAGWVNAYEQSKHEAEELVANSGLAWTIMRSSTVVCDTARGGITQRNAIHRSLAMLYRGLAPMLPGSATVPVDLVTTEHVTRAIIDGLRNSAAIGGIFHLCAGSGALPLAEFLDVAFAWWSRDDAWRRRGIARPALADLETYRLFERDVDEVASPSLKRITRALSFFAPQLAYPKHFDTTCAQRFLGYAAPAVREFLPLVAAAIAESAQ